MLVVPVALSLEALRASRLVCAVIFRIESASTPIWSTSGIEKFLGGGGTIVADIYRNL